MVIISTMRGKEKKTDYDYGFSNEDGEAWASRIKKSGSRRRTGDEDLGGTFEPAPGGAVCGGVV